MLKITGEISQDAQKVELLAGRPAHAKREFTTDDLGLVARAFALHARIDGTGNVTLIRDYVALHVKGMGEWTRVPTDAADAIAMWESDVAARAEEKRLDAEETAAIHREELNELTKWHRDWLALPEPTPENPGPSAPSDRNYSAWFHQLDADVVAAVKARLEKFEAANREIRYRREAMEAENKAVAARKARERLELLAQLVRDWGGHLAVERIDQRLLPDGSPLGLLPEKEAVEIVTDHLLPLDPDVGLGPYVKIVGKEVQKFCKKDDYDELHTDLAFLALDADEEEVGGLSVDEWAAVKSITAAVNKWFDGDFFRRSTVECEITPRVHRGQCRERGCPTWPVRRVSVLVKVTIDDLLTVAREYGGPLE